MTPYKQILLTADGCFGYRTCEPKYSEWHPSDYYAVKEQWQSSAEKLEWADGEYNKLSDYFEQNCPPTRDITDLVEVVDINATRIVQPYLPVYRLYFKPQQVEESQEELLECIMKLHLKGYAYDQILEQFKITKL